jgi:ElaB/YqjD/DUF883 family membrane-anchored ribosome-binding protein
MARHFFDRLGQNIKEMVDTAGDALGDVGKIAEEKLSDSRIKYQIRQLEAEIKRVEREIGKTFYRQAKKDGIDLDAFEAHIHQIDAIKEEIKALKSSIGEDIVEGEGYCFACGAKNPENAKFCQHCGAKLETVRRTYSQTFEREQEPESSEADQATYVNLGGVERDQD